MDDAPRNPEWQSGYIPPASEWNGEFGSKVDYPAPPEQGGTGLTDVPANGQIPIGNGTGYTLAHITPGTGISIVNAAGSVTISASQFNTIPGPGNRMDLAHRGFRGVRPENTMPAFELVAAYNRMGRRYGLEFDIQNTSDNVPVCLHNATVDATTNGTGPIAGMTLAAARALDAGFRFSGGVYAGVGVKIPTLAEVFLTYKSRIPFFLPEIKAYTTETAFDNMMAAVATAGVASVTWWQANLTDLEKVRDANSTVGLCKTSTSFTLADIDALALLGGRLMFFFDYAWGLANPTLIAAAKGAGIGVLAYVAPNGFVINQLTQAGIYGAAVDIPWEIA